MAHLGAMLQVYNSGPQVRTLWYEYRDLRDRRKVLEDEAELAKSKTGQTADPTSSPDSDGLTNGESVDSRGVLEDEAKSANAKTGQTIAPRPNSDSNHVTSGNPVSSRGMLNFGSPKLQIWLKYE
jgi:hypothetical protein